MSLNDVPAFLNATAGPETTEVISTMDWIMEKVDRFPVKISFIFACLMVFGSVLPYIPQYFTIKQTQNIKGFSLYVCLTLLVANILRIMFWFGKHFETPLLIQSILMIVAMFGLLELCVRVRNSNLIVQGRQHYFAGENEPESLKQKNSNKNSSKKAASIITLDGVATSAEGCGGGGGGAKRSRSSSGCCISPNAALVVTNRGDGGGARNLVIINPNSTATPTTINNNNNNNNNNSIDSKSAAAAATEDPLLAVANNTVSSTVFDQLIIPSPNTILNQLINQNPNNNSSSNDSSTSSSSPSNRSHGGANALSSNKQQQSTGSSMISDDCVVDRGVCDPAQQQSQQQSSLLAFVNQSDDVMTSCSPTTTTTTTGPKDLSTANLQQVGSSSIRSSAASLIAADNCAPIPKKQAASHNNNNDESSQEDANNQTCAKQKNTPPPPPPHSFSSPNLGAKTKPDGVPISPMINNNHNRSDHIDDDDDNGDDRIVTKYSINMMRSDVQDEQDTTIAIGEEGSPTSNGNKAAHQVVTVITAAAEHDDWPSNRHFFDFDMRYFWEWTDFISYLECMAVFAFFTGLVMFFFIDQPVVVETYGLVALVTESLLASPQFYRNFKTKSTEGMSRMMVFMWLVGDLYKTIYFVVRAAPFQFLLCGFTQITFDILIFIQVIVYKKANYRKLSKAGKLAVNQVTPSIQVVNNEKQLQQQQQQQDNLRENLKQRHVSFSSSTTDELRKTVETIAMHKLD